MLELSADQKLILESKHHKMMLVFVVEGLHEYQETTVTYGNNVNYGQNGIIYGGKYYQKKFLEPIKWVTTCDYTKLLDYGDGYAYGEINPLTNNEIFYGDIVKDKNTRGFIMLSGATTKSINQNIRRSESTTTSISNISMQLADFNGEITEIVSFNNIYGDLLSKKASLYINFDSKNHEEESILLFSGVIESIELGQGYCTLGVSHNTSKQRAKIFPMAKGALNLDLSNLPTNTINYTIDGSLDFIDPTPYLAYGFKTYVLVEQELIRYQTKSSGSLSGLVRDVTNNYQLGTLGVAHKKEAKISQVISLEGDFVDVALRVLMSGSSEINAFNVYPQGAEMLAENIDLDSFFYVKNILLNGSPEIFIYIKEEIEVKGFLEKIIYSTFGCYSIPKVNGKIGLGYLAPPFTASSVKVFNSENVTNPDKLKVVRGVNENFYNSVIFKFNHNPVLDRFEAGEILEDEDSFNRIATNSRPLVIESKCLIDTPSIRNFLLQQSRRYLDRYKFGAEKFPNVGVMFRDGFAVDVGDVVQFGDNPLQVSDTTNGTRKFTPRIVEVINKKMDFVSGKVELELLDTNFQTLARYGVISPSSIVDVGSTGELIKVKPSYGFAGQEFEKYTKFIGEKISIHNKDFSLYFETILTGATVNGLSVSPSIPFTVLENYFVDGPTYLDGGFDEDWKNDHVFFQGFSLILSASSTSIEVSSSEISKFHEGSKVVLATSSGVYGAELTALSISGNFIFFNTSLNVPVTAGDWVYSASFEKLQPVYRYY